jgi:hypothetical protein
MIDDRLRIVQTDATLRLFLSGRRHQMRLANHGRRDLRRLRDIASDVIAFRIEFLALQRSTEYAVPAHRVRARQDAPLPIPIVRGDIGNRQPSHEVALPV